MVTGLTDRLAYNLRRIRQERGETILTFSETIKLHRVHYQRLESAKRNVSLETIERYARVLGLDDPMELLLMPGDCPDPETAERS